MTSSPLDVIASSQSEGDILTKAIQSLGRQDELPSFWTKIANSETYSADHRRRAVFALFGRHIPVGLSLSEFARILDNPTWLHDADISIITRLGGKLPVQWSDTDTIFLLTIFPGVPDGIYQNWAIYLKVAGKVTRDAFVGLLHGSQADVKTGNATILEIGYAPPNPFQIK